MKIAAVVISVVFLIFPTISNSQGGSLQRTIDPEKLENQRYHHEYMLQQQMIDTLDRLFGSKRATETLPDVNGVLALRDSDVFQLTMFGSLTNMQPRHHEEWRGLAAALQSLARTQREPQLRHLELQALWFTLLSNEGDFIDLDAKALAKQPASVRNQINGICSSDQDAFVDLNVPCWMLAKYMAIDPTKLDQYARTTAMDVPTGYYRIDTLDIDTTNLRMKNGKWVGKNDEEASLEKLTAHTFYDVPKKQTK